MTNISTSNQPYSIKTFELLDPSDQPGTQRLEYSLSKQKLSVIDMQGRVLQSFKAVSGPWGKGALPKGEYILGGKPRAKNATNDKNWKAFCDNQNQCWSQTIKPQFKTERSLLAIHPDGNIAGTLGCIGLKNSDTKGFRDYLTTQLKEKPGMRLTVVP